MTSIPTPTVRALLLCSLAVALALFAAYDSRAARDQHATEPVTVLTITRFEADIVPGSDVLEHRPPRINLIIRDVAGEVVGRVRSEEPLRTLLRHGFYSVDVSLSRSGRVRRTCRTRLRTSRPGGALVTLVIGRNDRCDVYADVGETRVRAPDVGGLSPEDASCVLRAAGLRMRTYGSGGGLGRGCPPDEYKANIVIGGQRPAAGQSARRGTRVAVALSCAEIPSGCR